MQSLRFVTYYTKSIIALAATVVLYSLLNLPIRNLDVNFWLLALLTVVCSSRIAIRIPYFNGQITVSDTFIFLTMLLYGGEAAVLLAAVEGCCSSLPVGRKPITILFNGSIMAVSVFITTTVVQLFFGPVSDLPRNEHLPTLVTAICVIAFVQYISNSGLAAVYTAFKVNQRVGQTWSKYYLWTSITYLAGASAAGIVSRIVIRSGFQYVILATPIIVTIYLTYRTYSKNLEASASQAEQAERERMRAHYAQIEKLSALGELSSGVAHNFNNTLAGILARAQLLLKSRDYDEIRSGLNIIIQTAEDGAKTVKRIQDFARQRRDQDFVPIDVDQLVLEVGEITRPRWKDRAEAMNVHIAINRQITSNATILGDSGELREVLINMVFNAVDAMPRGGRLTLSTKDVNGAAEISISDTGHGMSEEVRSRIFDPFYTTKGKGGMGLGLSVSYGIIMRHEGTIEVESEINYGTTFRITFPVVSKALHTVAEENEFLLPASTHPGRLRILVIDDEEHVREVLHDILKQEGCEAVLSPDAYDALAKFDAESFDAIFTDVGLPGMNGWEFARSIRRRDRFIPLAVITGWGDTVSHEEQAASQADWIIPKPFNVERIVSLIAEISLRKTPPGDYVAWDPEAPLQ